MPPDEYCMHGMKSGIFIHEQNRLTFTMTSGGTSCCWLQRNHNSYYILFHLVGVCGFLLLLLFRNVCCDCSSEKGKPVSGKRIAHTKWRRKAYLLHTIYIYINVCAIGIHEQVGWWWWQRRRLQCVIHSDSRELCKKEKRKKKKTHAKHNEPILFLAQVPTKRKNQSSVSRKLISTDTSVWPLPH